MYAIRSYYDNFRDRFANWPVRIEVLSRFKSAKEQKLALDALGDGKLDIIIGTHKLLSDDIRFKDLGLLIVDEEHRFGVRQKEKLKALRADVDILTLTATPIPRTLNMARITSYNVCYTKLLRAAAPPSSGCPSPACR